MDENEKGRCLVGVHLMKYLERSSEDIVGELDQLQGSGSFHFYF